MQVFTLLFKRSGVRIFIFLEETKIKQECIKLLHSISISNKCFSFLSVLIQLSIKGLFHFQI